ncbi:cilia- and flagella-associated protein 74 [Sorex fumeus]|uniref:cilia- and flagella-associated protein 74 n=1 Tax=Sorex fumeus TaxID=62283 RepID=UPI0024ADC508|nr:cilia- and flagella-associated protein 74 [Sorex fumeus]
MEEDANSFPEEVLLANDPLVENACVLSWLSSGKEQKKRDIQAKSRELQLRKDLNILEMLHKKKELSIQKMRRELHACRQRMDFIAKQQATVSANLAVEREANNIAAVGRLQAVSRSLCTELEKEEEQKSQLMAMLRENENAMWHIEIQKVKFKDFQKSVHEKAMAASRCLQVRAAQQLRQHEAASARKARSQLLRVRKSMEMQKEQGLRHQKLLADAQRNHRVAVKFLKATLGRVRERTREEELASQEHMRRRMDAVLALKNNITANRELLRKIQAWSQAKTNVAQQKAQAEEKEILAQGGDAFKHLVHQRKRQELEAQTKAFEEEQKLRKLEIVSRILKEESEEENRKKQQHEPAQTTRRLTLRDKTWKYISDFSRGCAMPAGTVHLPYDFSVTPQSSQLLQAASTDFAQSDLWPLNAEEETLAKPEIPGLWDEDFKLCQAPKEDMDRKPVGGTKMEKDILARTLEKLRSGLVHKQVVSGREFKGCPFNSKPKVIHFKDFDVGKVYKKKITLINATYTINYCRLEGVEEHLRDFIHIHFDPPGPMSAGMSCEVLVTFKPLVNKDMEGSVSFLAQTGRFSVPLKCSTKKCSLKLDKQLIDFGSYVVGETVTRVITMTNVGGLATDFIILPESEFCELDARATNPFGYEEKALYDKITSYSENFSEAPELFTDNMFIPRGLGKLDSRDQEEKSSSESDEMMTTTFVMSPQSEDRVEISLGEVREGKIDPFCSVRVPIIFTPATPGVVRAKFKILFKNQQCQALLFSAIGTAVDVPVWVPDPEVDLKICMYDRLYQTSILIQTRSKVALRLKLEVCKELRAHFELLPEMGYIQALSSFSVQLKFLPRHSLPEDAGKYFDKESRVLEAPMTIRVADQIRPVEFTVHAIVTTSDLQLSPSVVDFGYCTIYEAIRAEINLCNCSLLPQEFGFVGLPQFVDIQPSDGFGTILPLETLQLDVIFKPTKAKEYSFELICKSEIGRCFKLECQAVAVSPPLELSHCQIKFAATALSGSSVATLYVVSTHGVPTGSQDAGPTSFEFLVPLDAPITISPCVGTVFPGKRCLVQVTFGPKLPAELKQQEPFQTKDEVKLHRRSTTQRREPRKSSVSQRQSHEQEHRARQSQASHLQEPPGKELVSSLDQYQALQGSLARSFQGKFDKFVVPCVVASGDLRDKEGMEPLNFSPHHTLYLELWCPTVAPSIMVMSNNGRTVVEFDEVAIGHSILRKVSIQNVCPQDLDVDFSLLNPDGPFVLLNPISKLATGESHTLVLSFSPRQNVLAQEALDIITKRGALTLTLRGTGVEPRITCSIQGDILHMGYVIARESVSVGFKLQNCSSLPVEFSMQLDSLADSRSNTQVPLPRFLAAGAVGLHRTEVVGTQNYGGQSVFSVVPVEGILEPGQAQDFTLTFSPDHESLYFSDRLRVVLFNKNTSRQILLKGAAREHSMFVEGGDPLDVPVESLSTVPLLEHGEGSAPHLEGEELKGILVTLDYIQLDEDTPASPATRELQVGCIRSNQPTSKKVVDFSLDSVSSLQHKGFTVEPTKGFVERGQTKTISISWVPPPNFDSDHPLVVSALLQLRGDVKETYKILFVAQVLTSATPPSPPVLLSLVPKARAPTPASTSELA